MKNDQELDEFLTETIQKLGKEKPETLSPFEKIEIEAIFREFYKKNCENLPFQKKTTLCKDTIHWMGLEDLKDIGYFIISFNKNEADIEKNISSFMYRLRT